MHVDEAVRQSIVAEIDVLTQLPSHKHISMCVLCVVSTVGTFCGTHLCCVYCGYILFVVHYV